MWCLLITLKTHKLYLWLFGQQARTKVTWSDRGKQASLGGWVWQNISVDQKLYTLFHHVLCTLCWLWSLLDWEICYPHPFLGRVEVCFRSRETCRYLKIPYLACSLLVAGNSTLHSKTLLKGASKATDRHQRCLKVAKAFAVPCFSHARWKNGQNAGIIRKPVPLCHFLSLNSEMNSALHILFCLIFFTVAVLNMLLAVNLRV